MADAHVVAFMSCTPLYANQETFTRDVEKGLSDERSRRSPAGSGGAQDKWARGRADLGRAPKTGSILSHDFNPKAWTLRGLRRATGRTRRGG